MPLSQQTVLEILHSLAAPNGGGTLVESGAVRNIQIDGDTVHVELAVEASQPGATRGLRGAG